jgi:hypothetical protein
MTCLELYHGHTLIVVVFLFKAISLQYFSDLVALLLMCFAASAKLVLYASFWYAERRNKELHKICCRLVCEDMYPFIVFGT